MHVSRYKTNRPVYMHDIFTYTRKVANKSKKYASLPLFRFPFHSVLLARPRFLKDKRTDDGLGKWSVLDDPFFWCFILFILSHSFSFFNNSPRLNKKLKRVSLFRESSTKNIRFTDTHDFHQFFLPNFGKTFAITLGGGGGKRGGKGGSEEYLSKTFNSMLCY